MRSHSRKHPLRDNQKKNVPLGMSCLSLAAFTAVGALSPGETYVALAVSDVSRGEKTDTGYTDNGEKDEDLETLNRLDFRSTHSGTRFPRTRNVLSRRLRGFSD